MSATQSGIYRIDGPNGKFYIGSAKRFKTRWSGHLSHLRKGTHANQKLQMAWNKYGEQAFVFSIVEVVDDHSKLIEREQHWIDKTEAVANGYNILLVADRRTGLKASEATKRKQSIAHTGRKHGPMSEEQKAYYSSLYSGRKLSEETRRRMSEARTGREFSDETRQKIAAVHLGKPKSDEHKAKLSAAKLGKKQSPEMIEARMRGMREARLKRQTTAASAAFFIPD